MAYATWLKDKTGKAYHLPTEAEWEYAARAGTETVYPWGNDLGKNKANCANAACGDRYQYTAPVGSFSAYNGLYDMHGNVSELTCSAYKKSYNSEESHCANTVKDVALVQRGGSFVFRGNYLRSASRHSYWSGNSGFDIGMRLAFDQPSSASIASSNKKAIATSGQTGARFAEVVMAANKSQIFTNK